jgi:16S rRNA processing protein RimM
LSERRAGRVGRAHGLDGSFYVDAPVIELLHEGTGVSVAGRGATVVRRAGTDRRPLVRVSGVDDRTAAEALRGEELLADADEAETAVAGEWDAEDLIGCEVPGIGPVTRVVAAPSCDLLEVGPSGVLVPFVSDAVLRVDTQARVIEVDLRFLGLGEEAAPGSGESPAAT